MDARHCAALEGNLLFHSVSKSGAESALQECCREGLKLQGWLLVQFSQADAGGLVSVVFQRLETWPSEKTVDRSKMFFHFLLKYLLKHPYNYPDSCGNTAYHSTNHTGFGNAFAFSIHSSCLHFLKIPLAHIPSWDTCEI